MIEITLAFLSLATLIFIIAVLGRMACDELSEIAQRLHRAAPDQRGVRGPVLANGDIFDILTEKSPFKRIFFRFFFPATTPHFTKLKQQYVFAEKHLEGRSLKDDSHAIFAIPPNVDPSRF